MEVHCTGYAQCANYEKTANVVAALELLFPDRVKSRLHEHADRAAFLAWLPQKLAELGPGASGHTGSPLVWLGDNQYVGGVDATLAYVRENYLSDPTSADVALAAGGDEAKGEDVIVDDTEYDFDLIVIGGGSGGLACSKEAAKLGARTAVLDYVKPSPAGSQWGLGGTCVNVGCIPKKLMHRAGIVAETLQDAEAFGWGERERGDHDWERLVESVQDHIGSLNFGYRVTLRDANVTYFNRLARFTGPHSIVATEQNGTEHTMTAKRFVVAVGGRPTPLSCPGAELAISSDDLFSLESPPGRTLVVGASYVALECAGFLTALGKDVTVMVRSILLRGFDQECAEKIGDHMAETGTKFIRGQVPSSLTKTDDGRIRVAWSPSSGDGAGGSDVFDTVLVAIGRRADTDGLGLDTTGIEMDKRGKIIAPQEVSSASHIAAIGDVISGRPELTPVAIRAGLLLARRWFDGGVEQMDYDNIPTTVFTPLEYGACGLSEEEALERCGEDGVEVYHSSFTPLEWTVCEDRPTDACFAKLVCDKRPGKSMRVLGLHFLGPNSGEVTQGFGVAMRLGATYADISSTVGIHPTCAEELTTLTVTKASGEDAAKGGC